MNRETIKQIEIDKAWDAFENPPELYRLWKDEGNPLAGRFLANKYHWGDEENGIFINPDKAREIYEEIGEDYETWENEPDEPDPKTHDYIITGSSVELEGVKLLIDNLAERFGMPGNEFGLYVPVGVLMRVIVGSPYYEGNILYMESESPEKLVITAELEKPSALLYALRLAFKNLKISSEFEKKQNKKEHVKECLLSVKDGSLLGPYKAIWEFSEGLAPAKPLDSDNYGYIDLEGNIIIAPQFEAAYYFYEGLAQVETKHGRKFFINKQGEKVLEPLFDDFGHFSDGLAWVEKNGKYGFIDKSGKVVIEPQFDHYGYFREGYAKLGKETIIDRIGKIATPPEEWLKRKDSHQGPVYTAFEKDGLKGFKDEEDNVVLEPFLDCDAEYAFDGIARVSKNGLVGYLKVPSGEWLKEPQFKDGNRTADSNGFILVTLP